MDQQLAKPSLFFCSFRDNALAQVKPVQVDLKTISTNNPRPKASKGPSSMGFEPISLQSMEFTRSRARLLAWKLVRMQPLSTDAGSVLLYSIPRAKSIQIKKCRTVAPCVFTGEGRDPSIDSARLRVVELELESPLNSTGCDVAYLNAYRAYALTVDVNFRQKANPYGKLRFFVSRKLGASLEALFAMTHPEYLKSQKSPFEEYRDSANAIYKLSQSTSIGADSMT